MPPKRRTPRQRDEDANAIEAYHNRQRIAAALARNDRSSMYSLRQVERLLWPDGAPDMPILSDNTPTVPYMHVVARRARSPIARQAQGPIPPPATQAVANATHAPTPRTHTPTPPNNPSPVGSSRSIAPSDDDSQGGEGPAVAVAVAPVRAGAPVVDNAYFEAVRHGRPWYVLPARVLKPNGRPDVIKCRGALAA